jgi:hypothetical protein
MPPISDTTRHCHEMGRSAELTLDCRKALLRAPCRDSWRFISARVRSGTGLQRSQYGLSIPGVIAAYTLHTGCLASIIPFRVRQTVDRCKYATDDAMATLCMCFRRYLYRFLFY